MKIPIISYSIVKSGDLFEKGIRDLIKECGSKALSDANLKRSDIDTVYISNCFSLKTANSALLGTIVHEELEIKNTIVISNGDASGAISIQEGAKAVKLGHKNVMILGVEKVSDFKVSEISELSSSLLGTDEAMSGSSVFAQFAMITSKYLHDYKLKNSDLSFIPISNHKNAMANEYAQFRSELNDQKINLSPYISEPLRMMECASYCDGACALILSSDSKQKAKGHYLGGSSFTDSFLSKRKSILDNESTKNAAHDALKESGVKLSDISIMELHDITPVCEVLAIEDMGFSKKGHGLEYIKANFSKINQSGGLKACGHAFGATGVRQAIDVVKRLKGKENGLTHTLSGVGSVSSVNIFEGV